MFFNCCRGLANERDFFGFAECALPFRVTSAVPDNLGLGEGCNRLRRLAIHFGIDQK
jgi:hypothetical protein